MGGAERRESSSQSKKELVVIVMGSMSNLDHAKKIRKTLDEFGVESVLRVGSAHTTPRYVLDVIIPDYENLRDRKVVYIAAAGRANALGGLIDGESIKPVVSLSLLGEGESGYASVDPFSALRVASGIGTTVALDPETAALAAIKAFALSNPELVDKLMAYKRRLKEKKNQDDQKAQGL